MCVPSHCFPPPAVLLCTGRIPQELGALTKLAILVLASNQLTCKWGTPPYFVPPVGSEEDSSPTHRLDPFPMCDREDETLT